MAYHNGIINVQRKYSQLFAERLHKMEGDFMLDTPENIQETVNELHELFSTIDSSEFADVDFSYLYEDEAETGAFHGDIKEH